MAKHALLIRDELERAARDAEFIGDAWRRDLGNDLIRHGGAIFVKPLPQVATGELSVVLCGVSRCWRAQVYPDWLDYLHVVGPHETVEADEAWLADWVLVKQRTSEEGPPVSSVRKVAINEYWKAAGTPKRPGCIKPSSLYDGQPRVPLFPKHHK